MTKEDEKDRNFLQIAIQFSEILKKTRWWQFKKRWRCEQGIIAAYLDYQGHHELADKVVTKALK